MHRLVELRGQNLLLEADAALSEEGPESRERASDLLDKAIAIDPEYDDAMAYMNLLHRQRADLADTKQEAEAEVKVADQWVQKALEAKKIKAERLEKKSAGGIVQEDTK